MSLDKEFFGLVGPTLIGQGECVAMIENGPKYCVAKSAVPTKTDPFSPIIDLIEWLNIKGQGGSKAAALAGKPIYYIGWEPANHEATMAAQNNWKFEKLPKKTLTSKDQDKLEMRIFNESAVKEEVPSRAVSSAMVAFKITQLAPGPAILLTEKL